MMHGHALRRKLPKIVGQLLINAKTPERRRVNGGHYAKMIFALSVNSRALHGLLD